MSTTQDNATEDTQRVIADLRQERDAALARETALAEVLNVINRSPGDPGLVFDAILEKAHKLCGAAVGSLMTYDGTFVRARATRGFPEQHEALIRRPFRPHPGLERLIRGDRLFHIADMKTLESQLDSEVSRSTIERTKVRTCLTVPLRKDATFLGYISAFRLEVRPFSGAEISLLETFAAQAVIAMENARLLGELQERTAALAQRNSEYGERIEQQAATIDVLKAMSASSGDAQPVFRLIVERARAFCNADNANLALVDGDMLHAQATTITGSSENASYMAQFPRPVDATSMFGRAILARDAVQTPDVRADPQHFTKTISGEITVRALVAVPLLRAGAPIGAIVLARNIPGEFSATQVELLRTFAEQAVIAISSAQTYRALQIRTADLQESLEYQTATSDVLKVISQSTFDLQPVLDTVAQTAARLCDADQAAIARRDGEWFHLAANFGFPPEYEAFMRGRGRLFTLEARGPAVAVRAAVECRPVHVRDVATVPGYPEGAIKLGRQRTSLGVPLLREGVPIGVLLLARQRVEPFTDKQIELVKIFADQAVIAIENTRLITEQREALEQQTATADVLQVINASPGDLAPVFDAMLDKALRLCDANFGQLISFDGVGFRAAAWQGLPPEPNRPVATTPPTPGMALYRLIHGEEVVHVPDITADEVYRSGNPTRRRLADKFGGRTAIWVALKKDTALLGAFVIYRTEVRPFFHKQIALLQNFGAQAVIAIENARLLGELRARTGELTRSVAELQALEEVMRAVNSSLDLDTVLATIINRAVRLSQADEGTIYEYDVSGQVFVPKSAFGMSAERVAALRDRRIKLGETHLGRSAMLRAPVYVDDVQRDASVPNAGEVLPGIHAVLAVPLLREDTVVGGLVIRRRSEAGFASTIVTLMQTFAGQSVLAIENARLFQEAGRARAAAEATLTDLRRTQDRLVQTEKMASLGQLTAGIAHEIKNPLNFVNNFSDLSVDLLNELQDAVAPDKLAVADGLRTEIDDITTTLKGNLEKISEHGRRADSIVKNMLLHSRTGPSEHRAIDLNTTVEEALNLAYHGARAETPGFNITMEKDLDPKAGTVDLYPQEFIRVMLNLIGNGFYAARNRANQPANPDYEPTLRLTTRDLGGLVEIRVRDNGTGINDAVRDKIFEPFFTTKPSGEGTGLGLSLSYDIVVKQHGGLLTVDSQIDAFTEFTITLPRRMTTIEGGTP